MLMTCRKRADASHGKYESFNFALKHSIINSNFNRCLKGVIIIKTSNVASHITKPYSLLPPDFSLRTKNAPSEFILGVLCKRYRGQVPYYFLCKISQYGNMLHVASGWTVNNAKLHNEDKQAYL